MAAGLTGFWGIIQPAIKRGIAQSSVHLALISRFRVGDTGSETGEIYKPHGLAAA